MQLYLYMKGFYNNKFKEKNITYFIWIPDDVPLPKFWETQHPRKKSNRLKKKHAIFCLIAWTFLIISYDSCKVNVILSGPSNQRYVACHCLLLKFSNLQKWQFLFPISCSFLSLVLIFLFLMLFCFEII